MKPKNVPLLIVWFWLAGILLLSCTRVQPDSMTLSDTPRSLTSVPITARPRPATQIPPQDPYRSPTSPFIKLTKATTRATFSTQIPTPTMDKATLISALNNNRGCDLPCFWGVLAEETAWEEANQTLNPFVFTKSRSSTSARGNPIYTFEQKISPSVSFGVAIEQKKDQLGSIEVWISEILGQVVPPDAFGYYRVDHVLQVLGLPTRILFRFDYPHEPPLVDEYIYSFWMVYDEEMVAFHYLGSKVLKVNQGTEVCPNQGIQGGLTGVELYIGNQYMERFDQDEYELLEDISSYSTSQFAKALIEQSQPCIPVDIGSYLSAQQK